MKYYSERFDETLIQETLENGLQVTILEKPQFQTTTCMFTTFFGSLDQKQVDDQGNIYSHPYGIAHFLEHKLFESDEGDVLKEFAKYGALVNAYTSYDETCYYFTTSSKKIDEPLNLLLDFVQELSITEASVAKEKKIIEQERLMYDQDPYSKMSLEGYRMMYEKHPLREDIVGTKESIESIRVEDLEKAYQLNYHPSKMHLLIFTHVPSLEVLNIVRDNQKRKIFTPIISVHRYIEKETEDVVMKRKDLKLDVSTPRCFVGYKLIPETCEPKKLLAKDWAIKMCFDAHFTSMNPNYQVWIDQKKITPFFTYEENYEKEYANLLFHDEVEDVDAFYQFIGQQIEEMKMTMISEQSLLQMKRRALGGFLSLFDNSETMVSTLSSSIQRNVSVFEEIKIIESLTTQQCFDVIRSIPFEQAICLRVVENEN